MTPGCDYRAMELSNMQEEGARRTDAELLDAMRTGGGPEARLAAGELFGRYRQRIYAFCLRYLGSRERALDASQDTLLAAFERIDAFEGRSAFSSWLFAIARNRCLNMLRQADYWREDEALPEDLRDGGAQPDRLVEELEDEQRMLALIRATLEPVEQRALWMRCFDKLPVDEITRLLGIESASGARALLQRARRKLRAAMDGR